MCDVRGDANYLPMTVTIVLACSAALLLLGMAAAIGGRTSRATPPVYGGTAAICLLVCAAALAGGDGALVLPIGLPWLGAHVRIDRLAGVFLTLVNLGGAGAALYAIGYGRHEHAPQRVLPFFPAFIAAMNLVVIADDAYTFLWAWELMSLASWALVMADHRSAGNRRAGIVYLIMATFSALTLLLAFGVLAASHGSYAFADMRLGPLPAWRAGLVLSLALIGAGSKAGLMPLHAWLPLAHPAAPSHASALMSGVMTKVAVYAFIRIVFDLLGPATWWWSVPVLIAGGTAAALGVLYALMEHDLKRLLAYHTVENIGIIFIGLGLALAFGANGLRGGAALALTAAVFHAFNHMLFKSVLFFGAGAVLTATGERDMGHLGGLIHRMPKTALAFLVACAAISALPPLNGFVSEWLTFQAILLHPDLPQWGLKIAVPADGALLALAAALAAACFVKAFGMCFLGRPRTTQAAQAREVDRFSLAAMFVFAAICLLAGVFPGAVIDWMAPVAQALTGAHMPTQIDRAWLAIAPVDEARGSYDGLLIFLFTGVAAMIAAALVHRLGSHAVRRARLWDCGYPDLGPTSQYSAAGFAQPIRRVFGPLVFRSSETVTMPPPGDRAPARIDKHMHDLAWEYLYQPVCDALLMVADVLNQLQFLTIRRYLSFVFLALVGLLLALTLWQ
jgi:formate hydrogenlyase subunit 3/multisubunit Na+/H+ antiporter MnhD subunit